MLRLRILGSRVRELFPQARGCSPKRSSENGPCQRTARRRSWAITRARVGGPSRNRACSYSRGSTSLARRHCELVSLFRGSMAGLKAPLSTLRLAPRYALRMTRGQSGLLFLSYQILYPGRNAHCRPPPPQIPAAGFKAPGSHLGGLTKKPASNSVVHHSASGPAYARARAGTRV